MDFGYDIEADQLPRLPLITNRRYSRTTKLL